MANTDGRPERSNSTWRAPLGFAVLGIGAALMLSSWLVPESRLQAIAWNDEQYEAYKQASIQVHQTAHQRSLHPEDPAAEAAVVEAQRNMQNLRSEADAARRTAVLWRWLARIAGLALVLVGAALSRLKFSASSD